MKCGHCSKKISPVPEKKLSTVLSGEIIRVKSIDKKLEVGLKIKEIDNKLKSEILSWVFPKWQETDTEKKKSEKVS